MMCYTIGVGRRVGVGGGGGGVNEGCIFVDEHCIHQQAAQLLIGQCSTNKTGGYLHRPTTLKAY